MFIKNYFVNFFNTKKLFFRHCDKTSIQIINASKLLKLNCIFKNNKIKLYKKFDYKVLQT